MFRRTAVFAVAAFTSLSFASLDARATTLEDATSQRLNFSFPNGAVNKSSYDGPGYESFAPFAAFVAPEMLKVNTFTGQSLGSTLEFTLLSEAAAFDGTSPAFANKFGVVNEDGDFVSVLDTKLANPGSSAVLAQGANEEFKFALQSPEALFTSIDSDNKDFGAAHILAMEVNKAGTFEIAPTSLRGTSPIKFNFLEGDLILFIEDLLAFGNLTSSLVPASGDFDYNDFVVVVRQTPVPEPASMLLLGLGAFGAARARRRRSA